MKKSSFLKRCFGNGNERKSTKKVPLVISGPMPLTRAASLRDMRSAREEAVRAEQGRREGEKESQRREKERERGKLRKLPPSAGEEAGLVKPTLHAQETHAKKGVAGGRRAFWGRATGV